MTFSKFRLVERINPSTSEVVRKLVVLGDDHVEYTYLTDLNLDEVKARRDELLSTCRLIDAQYGKVAVSTRSKVLEEF